MAETALILEPDARDLLTASRLKDARACLRYHRLRYIDGFRARRDVAELRFGTLVHAGLEAWWRARMSGAPALEAALAAMQGEANPFDRARAEAMIVGYDARWADDAYEVLAVEIQFRAPLVNPTTGRRSQTWDIAGKLDAIVRERATHRALIVEHKTATGDISQGSEYWRRLRMDGQVSMYYEGARSLGYDVQGCLYDVLGKPGQRPLEVNKRRSVPETPEEYRERVAAAIAAEPAAYFQRGEVVRLETECADSMIDVWEIGRGIREATLSNRHPRNPDACVRWGRTCEFFDVCTGQASLEDASQFVRSENVFPELAEEPTPKEGA